LHQLGVMRAGCVNSVIYKSKKFYATRAMFLPIIQMWDTLFGHCRQTVYRREKQVKTMGLCGFCPTTQNGETCETGATKKTRTGSELWAAPNEPNGVWIEMRKCDG
jgi:hypothetical protein